MVLMYNLFGDIMTQKKIEIELRHVSPNPKVVKKAIEAANRVTVEMAAQQERKRFAERLTKLRKAAGLTQKQLSEKSGIDRTLITRYETGKSMPRPKAIKKLADAMGVSPALLDVSTLDNATPLETELLRKHGYNVRKVQHGLYAISMPGCPEITITDREAANIWDLCWEETNNAFLDVMEHYFVNLFIREAYANHEVKSITNQNGSDTTNEE